MVLPIVAGAYIVGAAAVAGVSAYFAGDTNIDRRNTSFITQNIDQTKSNEIIIGKNARVENLVIRDSMSLDANATAEQQQKSSTGLNPLLLVGGAVVAGYFVLRGKK
jgi:hypothetical protein